MLMGLESQRIQTFCFRIFRDHPKRKKTLIKEG